MVLFNYSTKEVTVKIVYYGPGLCGKTTNLQFIYDTLPSNSKSKMISLATNQDRTLFFDFLPLELGTMRGMKVRLQLYTVPGQVYYNSTRKLVLKGADGVVFVADSQDFAYDANIESFRNLKENLLEHGYDPEKLPCILQYNKRDLPNVLPVEALEEVLNDRELTSYESIATTGFNVLETLKAITRLVLQDVIKEHGLAPGDTITLEEIDFGMKARAAKRRTTMMDFDETPDSVWEDETPDDEGEDLFDGTSAEEFVFEEVEEPPKPGVESPPSAEAEPLVEPPPAEELDEGGAGPEDVIDEPVTPPAGEGPLPGGGSEVIEFEEEPVEAGQATPPDRPSGPLAIDEPRPAPVQEEPPAEESAPPTEEPAPQAAEPPTVEPEPEPKPKPEAAEPALPIREIPVTVELTPEEIQAGSFKIILNIKVKR